VNPNLDPLVVSTINQIGEAMRKRFDEEEKPGYSSHMLYDIWWNGSMRGGPDYHNMAGFLTETSLYRLATPHCYAAEEIPETFGERHKNLPAKIPSVNYTNPWLGGCWPFRKPVEYMLTASRAVLDLAAKTKEDYLYNFANSGAPSALSTSLRALHQRGNAFWRTICPFFVMLTTRTRLSAAAGASVINLFVSSGLRFRFSVVGSTPACSARLPIDRPPPSELAARKR